MNKTVKRIVDMTRPIGTVNDIQITYMGFAAPGKVNPTAHMETPAAQKHKEAI